ncbi:MAG: hypothetical protein L0Z53_09945 [Acidobacteriales bacterium]|nr:hypothetical protein [Terriglobales bacterium]
MKQPKPNLAQALDAWRQSLCKEVAVGSLYSRNPIAHKWKATYRSLVIRELVFWRLHDLLDHALLLGRSGGILGCRILLRSALETLAILIYLNRKMAAVVSGSESFHVFADLTTQLMLGSRDGSTPVQSINILTVLSWCERQYPGIEAVYNELSESAHPNYQGVCSGYSRIDEKNYVTQFGSRWPEFHGATWESLIVLTMEIFESEYNKEWLLRFEALEKWIEANDPTLEATKGGV